MDRQLWGCYAVNDHMQPRAFVADVLLFERLVIPVPPEGDPSALAAWDAWQPGRQQELLEILGGIAYPIPWSSRLRQQFAAKWAASGSADEVNAQADEIRRAFAGGVSPPAQQATIAVLGEELTDRVRDLPGVKALAVYADPLRFDREWYLTRAWPFVTARNPAGSGLRKVVLPGRKWSFSAGWPIVTARKPIDPSPPEYEVEKAVPADEYQLAKLLAGRFAIPENPDRSDQDMLKEAVDLAAEPAMADWRESYHAWISDMAASGLSDRTKVRQMDDMVKAYNSAVTKNKRAVAVKLSAVIVGTGVGMGAAILGGPVLGVAAAAPITAMADVAAKKVFGDGPSDRIAAGALLAEAARRLSKP